MDIQHQPIQRHSHEEEPRNTGLQTAMHDEDGHDKSVLKKVKAKAKKIKNTLGNKIHVHGHGHDHDHEHNEDEEEEDDDEVEQDPEVHGAPMYESSAARPGLSTNPQVQNLEKDPQAPKNRVEQSDPGNYQSKVTDPTGAGGKEAGVTPLISSFGKMEVSDDPGEHKPWSSTGSHDQFSPDSPPTETKTVGNEPNKPSQGSTAQEQSGGEGGEANKSGTLGEYGRKVAATVTEKLAPVYGKVAEAGSAVVTPVYEKVAGAGSAVVSKFPGTGAGKEQREGEEGKVGGAGKGVSVKEYVAEKLRPSDEDKALSEVISEALHKRKGDESPAKGKVTESPEVARRLGSDQNENHPVSSSNEVGKGMVESIKGTVASWWGKKGEKQQSSSHAEDKVPHQDHEDERRRLNESSN